MNRRTPFIIGLIFLAIAIWLQTTSIEVIKSVINRLDNMGYDLQLHTKIMTQSTVIKSPVVIVDIDDKSLRAEGRWPWRRSKLAQLIDQLRKKGAVVVAMDMMFADEEANIANVILKDLNQKHFQISNNFLKHELTRISPFFDEDKVFASSLGKMDVVLGMTFLPYPQQAGVLPQPLMTLTPEQSTQLDFRKAEGVIANISTLQKGARYAGFINVYADADGIIRRVPLVMSYGDKLYSSLALEAVQLYLLSKGRLVTEKYKTTETLEGILLNNKTVPTDSQGQVYIPFRGKSYTFPFYSATDILHDKEPADSLAGKIVFIGTAAVGLGDIHATAVQGAFPGIEIQATIADGILTHNFAYRPAWTKGAEIFLTLIVGLVLIVIFPFQGPRALTLFSIFIPLAFIFGNNLLWNQTGLILFVLIPIILSLALALLNILYGYLFETRRREQLKTMFGQYVPPTHIDHMLKGSGNFALYGENREMTVLFADIRNFTAISEPMTATELKNMLNEFFTPMTEIIFNHSGTIDKYIGDLIMAFWGAPLKDNNHIFNSLAAALAMQKKIVDINSQFKQKGWPEISLGIGLNSGMMSVGDMGSKFRRSYTVLGDSVNLASRVEGLTKFYGVKIIVTEVMTDHQTSFVFRKLDKVTVQGKKISLSIYELISLQEEVSTEIEEEVTKSDQAFELYCRQQWDAALKIYEQLHLQTPEVKLYTIFIRRINEFKATPPPSDWDGVYQHSHK